MHSNVVVPRLRRQADERQERREHRDGGAYVALRSCQSGLRLCVGWLPISNCVRVQDDSRRCSAPRNSASPRTTSPRRPRSRPPRPDRRASPPTTFRISAWWPPRRRRLPTPPSSTATAAARRSTGTRRRISRRCSSAATGTTTSRAAASRGGTTCTSGEGTCAAEASPPRAARHARHVLVRAVGRRGARAIARPAIARALGARTELAKPTTAETEWLAKELIAAPTRRSGPGSIDAILLEDDVNAYLNPTLSAQVKTLAKLAPSWTPIVNAVEFADSTAHAAAVARAGFGVASPELYQIDGDRCADCATKATGAGWRPAAALPRIPGSRPCGAPTTRSWLWATRRPPPARARRCGWRRRRSLPLAVRRVARRLRAEVHDGRGRARPRRCS